MYNISTNHQDFFTKTTEKPLKKLTELDRVMYKNILRTPNYDDFIPRPGQTKWGRNKYTKNKLMIM